MILIEKGLDFEAETGNN